MDIFCGNNLSLLHNPNLLVGLISYKLTPYTHYSKSHTPHDANLPSTARDTYSKSKYPNDSRKQHGSSEIGRLTSWRFSKSSLIQSSSILEDTCLPVPFIPQAVHFLGQCQDELKHILTRGCCFVTHLFTM